MACVGSRIFREPSVPARSGLGVFSVRPVAGRFVILQVSEMLRLEMPLRDVQKTLEFIGNRGVSGVFQWIEEMHHSRPSAGDTEFPGSRGGPLTDPAATNITGQFFLQLQT